ncbi:MAG: hypothetical protein DRQ47_08930, partial [Gammaproteobacteria bacterium]
YIVTYYRSMLAADTTVASTTGGDYVNVMATVSLFSGVEVSVPDWVTGSGVSAVPNCPQGSVVSGTEAVYFLAGVVDSSAWSPSFIPSGYTGAGGGVIGGLNLMTAYKIITSQEDPLAYGGTASSGSWIGITTSIQEA